MQPLAFDTETTGLELHKGAYMFSYSTCDWNGDAEVYRVDDKVSKKDLEWNTVYLKTMIDSKIPLIMHNAKFDFTAVENFLKIKIPYDYPFHDTHIQSNLLFNNQPSHKLKDLAWHFAEFPADDERALKHFKNNYHKAPRELMDPYQENDAQRAMLLHRFFYDRILAKKEFKENYDIELKLIRATMEMERRGVLVDQPACTKMQEELDIKCNKVLDDLQEYAGKRINPRSPDDVQWLLYKHGKLPIISRTPTTNKPSTNKDTLLELKEKFQPKSIDFVLMYRSWKKGIKDLQNYKEAADSDSIIHPNINTCAAITGRESCDNPNLMNVSKSSTLLTPYPVITRKVFKPRPGFINFHIDYAGIEMRLLVHYSGDKRMLQEFNKPDGDPHDLASKVFYQNQYTKSMKEDKKSLRGAGKNANFAIGYGGGPARIAQILGLYGSKGRAAFERHEKSFPELHAFHRKVARIASDEGKVFTTFGRQLKLAAEKSYVAANYIIQGTAADIIKTAQVRVHEYLQKYYAGEIFILLPIYDELIIEFPRKHLKDAQKILGDICKLMTDFDQFKVPLEVEVEVAVNNWEDKREFKLRSN